MRRTKNLENVRMELPSLQTIRTLTILKRPVDRLPNGAPQCSSRWNSTGSSRKQLATKNNLTIWPKELGTIAINLEMLRILKNTHQILREYIPISEETFTRFSRNTRHILRRASFAVPDLEKRFST